MVLTCITHSLENSTVFFTKDRENFAVFLTRRLLHIYIINII